MPLASVHKNDRVFLSTPVENLFIDEFMGKAPGEFVKVYLCGLRLCYDPTEADMTPEEMARALDTEPDLIVNAFSYWARQGLVEIVSRNPLTVRYQNIQQRLTQNAGDTQGYELRNLTQKAQKLLGESRLLDNHEVRAMADWIDTLGFSEEAALALVEHCVKTRGRRVSMAQMNKLAAVWADQGIRSGKDASGWVAQFDKAHQDTREILRLLGLHRAPTQEELRMHSTWTTEWGFTLEGIQAACRTMAGVQRPSFAYLDKVLQRLHSDGLHAGDAIALGARERSDKIDGLASVFRELGFAGSPATPEWIALFEKWFNTGFALSGLKTAAREVAREGRHTPQDLDAMLSWCGARGEVSDEALALRFQKRAEARTAMGKILGLWGENRSPSGPENSAYIRWRQEGHSPELIQSAAEAAIYARERLPYISRILEEWKKEGITSPGPKTKKPVAAKVNERVTADLRSTTLPDEEFYFRFDDE